MAQGKPIMDSKIGKIVFCSEYFSKWEFKWSDLKSTRRHSAGSVQSPNFNLITGTFCFSIQLELQSSNRDITHVLKLIRLSNTYMLRAVQLSIRGIGRIYQSEWFNGEPHLEFKASDIMEKVVICCEVREVSTKYSNKRRLGDLSIIQEIPSLEKKKKYHTKEDDTPRSKIEERRLEDLSIIQKIPSLEGTKGEDDTPRSKSTARLIGDLKEILISEKDSDVILKVEGREFKAHRLILGMRSPVFSAMFEHDMKERNSGVVPIEDCEQGIFPDFLHYIYTGTVEKLTSENAPGLYVTADKYQLLELKEECLDYMKKNVSVENFCDFMTVSLRHHERELTKIATEFFLEKAADIVMTTKWMTFLAANVVTANELFVKFTSNKGTM